MLPYLHGFIDQFLISGSPSVRPSVTVFRTFLLHALTYWSENFVYHFIFYARSSSNAINFRLFLQELCSFLTSNSYKYAVFRTFLLHSVTYWVQILYITLFLMYHRESLSVVIFSLIFVGVMPLCERGILEIHSFPHFSLTCFDILSWKFCIWLFFTVLQIKFECRQFCVNFCGSYAPFWTLNNGNTQFSALFSYTL